MHILLGVYGVWGWVMERNEIRGPTDFTIALGVQSYFTNRKMIQIFFVIFFCYENDLFKPTAILFVNEA